MDTQNGSSDVTQKTNPPMTWEEYFDSDEYERDRRAQNEYWKENATEEERREAVEAARLLQPVLEKIAAEQREEAKRREESETARALKAHASIPNKTDTSHRTGTVLDSGDGDDDNNAPQSQTQTLNPESPAVAAQALEVDSQASATDTASKPNRKIRISLFSADTDNEPQTYEVTWEEHVESLRTDRPVECPQTTLNEQREKIPVTICPSLTEGSANKCTARKVEMWSPSIYKGTRSDANVIGMSCIVCDFDHLTKEQAHDLVGKVDALGWKSILHSTHSHNPEKDDHCYRLVLAVTRELTRDEIKPTRDMAQAQLGIRADKQTNDLSRAYYLPTRPKNGPAFVFASDGTVEIEPVASFPAPAQSEGLVQSPTGSVSQAARRYPYRTISDMRQLDERVRKSKKSKEGTLLRKLIDGIPLAQQGRRDSALQSVAGSLAYLLPDALEEALIEMGRESITAMEPNEDGDWMPEWRDKVERACERYDKEVYQPKQAEKARVEEQTKSVLTKGSTQQGVPPQYALYLPKTCFVPLLDGKFDFSKSMGPKAAQLEKQRIRMPRLLREYPNDPDVRSLQSCDISRLEDHPLIIPAHGFTCEPYGPPVVVEGHNQYVNLYVRPAIDAIPHDFSDLMEMIRDPSKSRFPNFLRLMNYLSGEVEAERFFGTEWRLHWWAAKTQNPKSKLLTSYMLQGFQGTGKDTEFRAFMEVIGYENCAIVDQQTLESEFNASYAGKLFCLGSELGSRDRREKAKLERKVKGLITADKVLLNAKGIQGCDVKSPTTWGFTTNDRDALLISPTDRRHSFFSQEKTIPDEHKKLLKTFWDQKIKNKPSEMFVQEIGHLRYVLENLEVNYDLIDTPFRNEARAQAIENSRSSVDRFKRECEAVGYFRLKRNLGFYDNANEPEWVSASEIHEVYVKWADGYPSSLTKLGTHLKKDPNPWDSDKNKFGGLIYYKVPHAPQSEKGG